MKPADLDLHFFIDTIIPFKNEITPLNGNQNFIAYVTALSFCMSYIIGCLTCSEQHSVDQVFSRKLILVYSINNQSSAQYALLGACVLIRLNTAISI